jgi:hypothetical protein
LCLVCGMLSILKGLLIFLKGMWVVMNKLFFFRLFMSSVHFVKLMFKFNIWKKLPVVIIHCIHEKECFG